MYTRVSEGEVIEFTAGSAYSSGDVVAVGPLVGVVVADVASGAVGQLAVTGVFRLPKLDAAVIAVGDQVAWDTSSSAVDDPNITPAAGDVTAFGVALEAKGATTSENILVRLSPGAGTVN